MIFGVVSSVLVIAYPVAIYVGLERWDTRTLGLILLGLLATGLVPRLVMRMREVDPEERRAHLWPVLRVPASVIGLVALGTALDEPRFLLILPVLVNVLLLVQFASSLRGPVSLVERFARLQDPVLPPGGPKYCRTVTKVWCCFFVLNGATAAALAGFGPVSWWAVYNGMIAYILMGALFTVEYVARKAIFRQFDDTLPDRVLAAVLPTRAAPVHAGVDSAHEPNE